MKDYHDFVYLETDLIICFFNQLIKLFKANNSIFQLTIYMIL
jgi:hypothetical protein